MILGEQSIRSRNLIAGARSDNFHSASYDLSVREIIAPSGDVVTDFILPPQGMVKVISEEVVEIPDDVIGYVLVKTRLCNEGVLALNIGIVDPGFHGPLQSTLINFGNSKFLIEAGDVFSRITFHTLDAANKVEPVRYTHESVRKYVREESLRYLGSTFLDIDQTSREAAEKAFGNYKKSMWLAVPLIAVLISALTFCLNFANIWAVHSQLKPEQLAKDEVLTSEVDLRLRQLETENAELTRKLDAVIASRQAR
jgi:deoxycytidine triphosphate deaminase